MKKFFEGIGWRLTVILSCVCFSVGHVKAANTVYGYEYVDLGLPSGLLWATCNVGASSPEEYGDYFAWGETSSSTLDSYNYAGTYSILPSDKDAATRAMNYSWGCESFSESWRMPTYDEMLELKNNTTISSETVNGVAGRRLTSKKNSNSIFIPFGGYYEAGEPKNVDVYANLWTASSYSTTQGRACWFKTSSGLTFGGIDQNCKLAIRPVCPKIVKATGITIDRTNIEYTQSFSSGAWTYDYLIVTISPANATEKWFKVEIGDVGVTGPANENHDDEFGYLDKFDFRYDNYNDYYGVGDSYITVKTMDGSNLSATCTVHVSAEDEVEDDYVRLEGISLSTTAINHPLDRHDPDYCYATYPISIELEPYNASYESVEWTVSGNSWNSIVESIENEDDLNAIVNLLLEEESQSNVITVVVTSTDGTVYTATCEVSCYNANVYTGKCGDNLYYEIIDNSGYYCPGGAWWDNGPDISIWGTGDMYDYDQTGSPFSFGYGNRADYDGSLSIGNGVTSIGNEAFANNGFCVVSLPSTIRRIGSKAFADCRRLTSVSGLEKVSTIADDAFWNCMELNIPLEGIELTETRLELKVGESHSFELAKIYPNYFPQSDYFSVSGILSWTTSNESVLHADDFACEALSQGSANILVNGKKVCTVEVFNPAYDFEVDGIYYKIISNSPACVGVTRELGEDSPRPCYSGIVDIPSTVEYNGVSYQVTKILAQAFNFDEQLKEVNIPSTITNIEQLAFFDTGITEISIVNPNAKLEDRCFWNCPKLEKVTLADGVVLDCVFEECDKLNTLYLGAVPPVTTDAGIDVITKVTLYVPSGCTDVYKAHAYWRRFPNIIEYNVESDTDISQYSNIIFAQEQEMWGGEEDYITLYMNNTIEVNSFAFNMQLPEGFEYVLNAKGRPVVEWTGDREDDHTLTCNLLADGSLNVAGISLNGYTISGNEGALLRVKVKVPEDVDDEMNLVLRNIELADLASNPYKVERCVSTLIVKPYVLGDVNNDHLVTIADASGVVGMVVGTAPATLNRKAADVNKDNTVSIADASGIVAIVINYQPSAKAPLRDAKPIDFSLTAGTMSMAEDGTAELPICLNNAEQSTALQFDLALPAGMTLVGITPSEDHVAQFSRQSDGTYRIAILSLQNELFADATVMTLTLQGNGNANGRVIKASAIEVVDSNLNPCHPCDAFFSIDATGIETVGTDMDTMTYDLFGRRNDTRSNGIRIMGDQKVLNK